MRRRHNVIAATLFIVGILFLCARREADLSDYTLWNSGNDGEEESGAYVHAGSRLKLGQGAHSVTTSLPSQSTLASFIDKTQPELADQLLGPLPSQHNTEAQGKGPAAEPVQEPAALPPAPKQDAPTVFSPEFQFQNELDLELPSSVFKSYSNHVPLHHGPEKTYAYATFMATRNPSLKDPYFLAIHSLVYRVLWSARSRTQKYPFIVYVAEYVTTEQRQLLSGAGAIVRELKPVPWHCDKEGVQKRWTDLFAKLNMWAEVDYQRILFLDADAFPQVNIDVMFEVPSMQHCVQSKLDLDDLVPGHTAVCEPYIFAGVPQDTNPAAPNINVGSMVFTPSLHMHQRLMQNYLKYDKYDCAMAEQAFLNWQFSPEGAYPSTSLDRKWGGHFPKEEEEGQLNVVHEKIWAFGDGWTKKDWVNTWIEMSQFYTSEEFAKQRGALGTL